MKKPKMFSLDGKRELKIYTAIPDPNLINAFEGFPRTVGCDGEDVFLPAAWFKLTEPQILKLAQEDKQPFLRNEDGLLLIPFNWISEKLSIPEELYKYKKWILKTHSLPMLNSQ